MPEPRVKQMQDGVFRPTHIEIDTGRSRFRISDFGFRILSTHPVLFCVLISELTMILCVEITEIVPATARPLRHRICLTDGTIWQVHPVLGSCERWLAFGSRLVIVK